MDNLRRMLPSPNALFVFEAAARHRNFTRAAGELNVTQPAVSRMLGGLEAHLGTRLFLRGKEGVRLTEDGEALFRAVSEGFDGIRQQLATIEARRSGVATITLSVSTAFTTHWLMPRIDRFHRSFPSVDLRFQLVSGPIGGRYDDVDMAMRFVGPGDPSARGVRVMPEAYLPVCAPSYLGSLAGGTERPTFIGLSDGGGPAEFTGLDLPSPGSKTLLFSDYAVVVQTALLGQGIAAGWLNVVAHCLRQGSLVPVRQALTRPERECWILHPADRVVRPVVVEVRDWLVGELADDLAALRGAYPDLGLAEPARERAS